MVESSGPERTVNCSRPGCYRQAYWMLDAQRGFCTAVHLNDEVGAEARWTAGPERDGIRQVELKSPAKKRALFHHG
jgi:hypothetical protein